MKVGEHLLVCLSEECAEIIQIVDKALRFGLDDSHPKEPGSNYERIKREINDLHGVIELLSEQGIHFPMDRQLIDEKKEKVKKYMEYAKTRRTLETG